MEMQLHCSFVLSLLSAIPAIFFNLEKQRGGQSTIKNLIIDDTEVTD